MLDEEAIERFGRDLDDADFAARALTEDRDDDEDDEEADEEDEDAAAASAMPATSYIDHLATRRTGQHAGAARNGCARRHNVTNPCGAATSSVISPCPFASSAPVRSRHRHEVLCAWPPAQAAVRESDVVGRFGGEDSPRCCRAPTAPENGIAEQYARFRSALSVAAADARINVTDSIGIAVLGQHGNDLFELLAAADVALYRAKDAGRSGRIAPTPPGTGCENEDEATDACP